MKKIQPIAILTLSIFFGILLMGSANAEEPKRPVVNKTLDSKKEAKILKVKNLQIEQAFNRLQEMDFLADNDLMNKAIYTSFKDRRNEAIAHSVGYLKEPGMQIIEGRMVCQGRDFYVAKKVLQMFPDEALQPLLDLYEGGDPLTRGNVIRVMGNMEGDPIVRNLLVKALENKTICEQENPEMEGEPLRICDEAYNQLVLRYEIKNVLRTIGNAHTPEDRDYHIEILKSIL
jgi:hypothetical protein